MKLWVLFVMTITSSFGPVAKGSTCPPDNQPSVTLNTPSQGATQLSGHACNVDPTKAKIVVYALTNQWYVQPLADAPFTSIAADGTWTSFTFPWSSITVLLVDPSNYSPAATKITNPALDPGVLAWATYPAGPISVDFSGYTWGIKVTGAAPSDQFDPGPNFWSNDPSVVSVAPDGLHLNIANIAGSWQSAEVYLTEPLGYGTYTVQVASRLDQLDQNTVAAPLFIYAATGQELDFEYSGTGGLIPDPYNAQQVVQPYTVVGNIVRYVQPPTAQFTSQIEWQADHVTFRAWNGWSSVPSASDVIHEWTYTGAYIPSPDSALVHANLWLLNGTAPAGGAGDSMVIRSFVFQSGSVPQIQAVTDAADFQPVLSPGELFSIFGTNLASAPQQAASAPWPTSLGETSVVINNGSINNGSKVPLSYAGPGQVNGQIPYDAAPGNASVQVFVNGVASAPLSFSINPIAPRLFVGQNNSCIAQNEDGTLNSPSNPAHPGHYLVAYLTGLGAVSPPVGTGNAAPATPFSYPVTPGTAMLGSQSITPAYLGLTPLAVGVGQTNVLIPATFPSGVTGFSIVLGTVASQQCLPHWSRESGGHRSKTKCFHDRAIVGSAKWRH